MEHEKILRINELARLSRERALTPEEQAERDALRREYVAAFRANMEQTLSRVVIRGEDGTLCPLQKKTDKPGE